MNKIREIHINQGNIREIKRENYLENSNIRKIIWSLDYFDLDVLNKFPSVTDIDASYNNITTLFGLDVPNLEYLDISHNKITNIRNINLLKLEYLNISYNKITNLWEINLPRLEYLDVSHNKINDFDGLSVSKLEYLDISHNKITANSFNELNLKNNPNLACIKCNNNNIILFGENLEDNCCITQ